jgi:hypothetical protein
MLPMHRTPTPSAMRSNRLVSSAYKHGVRHNKYIQRFTRSRKQTQTHYQAKYVG